MFKIKIIYIFKELYVKNKKENIDLSLYGFKGIKLDLEKNFQTFEIIRNKYKDNEKKLEIFDHLIKDKFIDKPKCLILKNINRLFFIWYFIISFDF